MYNESTPWQELPKGLLNVNLECKNPCGHTLRPGNHMGEEGPRKAWKGHEMGNNRKQREEGKGLWQVNIPRVKSTECWNGSRWEINNSSCIALQYGFISLENLLTLLNNLQRHHFLKHGSPGHRKQCPIQHFQVKYPLGCLSPFTAWFCRAKLGQRGSKLQSEILPPHC